jgi:PTH1 family peptidyl-tRNA hydrolase
VNDRALGLIVGLGNPGAQYARTRHNVGFWLVESLAQMYSSGFSAETKFKAQVCRIDVGGNLLWLLKPETFMNDSGPSVAGYAAYYKIAPRETLVVHDDLGLGCGTVRLKQGGGHGGHNGLRDIASHFGVGFGRLRIGVGHPGSGRDVARYVLNAPPVDERELIEEALRRVLERIEIVVGGNFEAAATALDSCIPVK